MSSSQDGQYFMYHWESKKHPRWGVEQGSPTLSWGTKRPRRYKLVMQKEMAKRPWNWTVGGGTLLLRIWTISQYSGGFAFWIPTTSVVQMLLDRDSKSWSQFGSAPCDQRDKLSGRNGLQWRQGGASQFQICYCIKICASRNRNTGNFAHYEDHPGVI